MHAYKEENAAEPCNNPFSQVAACTHTNPNLLVQSLTETIQHRHVMTKHNDLPTTLQHIQDIVLHCGQLHLACHIKQGKEGGSSVKLLCMGNEWWVDLVHTNT